MGADNTKKSKPFNYSKFSAIIFIVIILIFLLIIIGCLLTWHTNCILLNYPTDFAKLRIARESLMNANTITFMVTLIVGLLASLLVYRIDKIEQLVKKNERLFKKIKGLVSENARIKRDNQNLKSEINKTANDINDISKAVKFDVIPMYVENIHSTANLMNIITHIMISQHSSDFRQIGYLCSRIELMIYRIHESLDREELSFSKVNLGKKDILNTYLDETLGILDEISSTIKKTNSKIYNNIDTLYHQMKDIKDKIDKMIHIENGK